MRWVSVSHTSLVTMTLLLLCALCRADAASARVRPTPVREADRVCAKCHQAIFENYIQTPMANASGLASERLILGGFRDAASGVDYSVSTDDDGEWLTYRKPSDREIAGRDRLQYFLGSGHLGLTYLYSKSGYLLESPVAYFADLKTYAMKPGLEDMAHLPGALLVDSTCLRCHMSAVQPADAGTANHYEGLPFLHSGITCESCHGDTRRHIATDGVATVVNLTKLDPARRDSVCIACHLEGTTSVERRGHSALDYKPGDNISDFVAYFAAAHESSTERGVSEIEQFSLSRCKQVSGAAMSCTNCHDPHRSPVATERVEFYRAKCLTCHSQASLAATHYPANRDCTSCHMPKTGARNIAHVAWTDHRIRQHPDLIDAPASQRDKARTLLPILLDGASARDLALGYYDLAVKGDTPQKDKAMTMLRETARSAPGDARVLEALGVLSEWNGDGAGAKGFYRAALKAEPTSLTATTNLGTLLAKAGDLTAAASLWRPAFERNADQLTLGENLATVECLLGERDRALHVLRGILIYSPDTPKVRSKLDAIESGQQECFADSFHKTR